MKRLLLTTVGVLCLGLVAVPAEAGAAVTFQGRVDVPAPMLIDAGPYAAPPTVELLVEPSWAVQQAADAAGETSSVLSVAQGTATPSFSLSLDLDSLDPRFVADEGYVNVMVAARYGGRVSTWGVTVWPGDAVKQVPAFNMSRAAVPPGGSITEASSIDAAAPPCLTIIWGNYNGPYQTKIMDVMNAQDPGDGLVLLPRIDLDDPGLLPDQRTELVGGRDDDQQFVQRLRILANATNQRIQALWMYRERAVVCVGNQNVPYNYYGRGATPSITHVNYSNCGGFYYPGDRYVHNESSNQTYSAGLTVYGINLSSKAGYLSTATLRFTFNVRGKVCGNSSISGENSPKVDARAM